MQIKNCILQRRGHAETLCRKSLRTKQVVNCEISGSNQLICLAYRHVKRQLHPWPNHHIDVRWKLLWVHWLTTLALPLRTTAPWKHSQRCYIAVSFIVVQCTLWTRRKSQINYLQHIRNYLAHTVELAAKFSNITPRSLHWLSANSSHSPIKFSQPANLTAYTTWYLFSLHVEPVPYPHARSFRNCGKVVQSLKVATKSHLWKEKTKLWGCSSVTINRTGPVPGQKWLIISLRLWIKIRMLLSNFLVNR